MISSSRVGSESKFKSSGDTCKQRVSNFEIATHFVIYIRNTEPGGQLIVDEI